eukprot:3391556-Pleurochrysis_carterae.AAC.1
MRPAPKTASSPACLKLKASADEKRGNQPCSFCVSWCQQNARIITAAPHRGALHAAQPTRLARRRRAAHTMLHA